MYYRVECALYESNALEKRCSSALRVGNTLCIRYQLATFFTIRTQIVFLLFFYGWTSSGVYIHTWKNAHIFEHAENVRRGWRTHVNDVHQAFSSNHQRILTHAQRITTHWPKFFIFLCAGCAWCIYILADPIPVHVDHACVLFDFAPMIFPQRPNYFKGGGGT